MSEYVASLDCGEGRPKPATGWLVALDLDGTVLDQHHAVRPDVRAEIAAARALGARVVIVSARAPAAVRHVMRGIGAVDAIICLGGAQMLVPGEAGWRADPALPPETLPPEEVRHVVGAARALGLSLGAFVDDEMVADRLDPSLREELRISGMTGYETDLMALQQPVLKLMAIAAPGHEDVLIRFRAEIGTQVASVLSHPQYLEVMRAGVSKGHALARLRDSWKIARGTCIAIGDSENDLSMFAEVGWPVAMGNGSKEVRAAALWVTETNRDGGVAVALRRFRAEEWRA